MSVCATLFGSRIAHTLTVIACVGLAACTHTVSTVPMHVGADRSLVLEGFARCSAEQPDQLDLREDEPLVVIVHGCLASGAEFRELSRVFEFHDQQTVCFNYNDRDSLRATASRFRRDLDSLRRHMPHQDLTVVGHSQGGLISRIALSEGVDSSQPGDGTMRLVTVSSPFSGIAAAEHCGLTWLHVLSLGITTGVCEAVAGSKWTEIPPSSRLWQEPIDLQPSVTSHVQIVTDERGSCRRHGEDGACEEDDHVFGTNEQINPRLLTDSRVDMATLVAGHGQVVGGEGIEPLELVRLLQAHGVMAPTPPGREQALATLIRSLF